MSTLANAGAELRAEAQAEPALPQIRCVLLLARRQLWLRYFLFGLEIVLAVLCLSVVSWICLERAFDPGPRWHLCARTFLLTLFLAGLCFLWFLSYRARLGTSALALRLEALVPAYKGQLLTAAEALEHPGSVPPAIAELSARRALEVHALNGHRALLPNLPWRRAHLAFAGALLVCWMAWYVWGTELFYILTRTVLPQSIANVWVQPKITEVIPGDTKVILGSTLNVTATLAGPIPERVQLEYEPDEPALSGMLNPMLPDDSNARWQGKLPQLFNSGRYRIRLPDYLQSDGHPLCSPWYTLSLRPNPKIVNVTITITPPDYMRSKPVRWTDSQEIRALEGSNIEVLLEAAPAGETIDGIAELPEGRRAVIQHNYDNAGISRFSCNFLAERSGIVRFFLLPREEQFAPAQTGFVLKVSPDLPPTAEAVIQPNATPERNGLPIDLRMEDDLGLVRGRLILQPLPEGEARTPVLLPARHYLEVALTPGSRAHAERWFIPYVGMEDWLTAGFQFRLEVMDNRYPQPQVAYSPLRKWIPPTSAAATPRRGLLENNPRRSLVRKDAMKEIPQVDDKMLKAMAEAERNRTEERSQRPTQLQRPEAEKLRSPEQPSTSKDTEPSSGSGTDDGAHPQQSQSDKGEDPPEPLQRPQQYRPEAPDSNRTQQQPLNEQQGGTSGESSRPDAGSERESQNKNDQDRQENENRKQLRQSVSHESDSRQTDRNESPDEKNSEDKSQTGNENAAGNSRESSTRSSGKTNGDTEANESQRQKTGSASAPDGMDSSQARTNPPVDSGEYDQPQGFGNAGDSGGDRSDRGERSSSSSSNEPDRQSLKAGHNLGDSERPSDSRKSGNEGRTGKPEQDREAGRQPDSAEIQRSGTKTSEQKQSRRETRNGSSQEGGEIPHPDDGKPEAQSAAGDSDTAPEAGGRIPGSGPEGKRKRDGGLKTGQESGPNAPKMAGADLEHLQRMQPVSEAEVEDFSKKMQSLETRTDYGHTRSQSETSNSPPKSTLPDSFKLTTPAKASEPTKQQKQVQASPSQEVDPAYKALVEAYFQRLRE